MKEPDFWEMVEFLQTRPPEERQKFVAVILTALFTAGTFPVVDIAEVQKEADAHILKN